MAVLAALIDRDVTWGVTGWRRRWLGNVAVLVTALGDRNGTGSSAGRSCRQQATPAMSRAHRGSRSTYAGRWRSAEP
jgi:hypothetical protein